MWMVVWRPQQIPLSLALFLKVLVRSRQNARYYPPCVFVKNQFYQKFHKTPRSKYLPLDHIFKNCF
jgi:hypothetical protein